MNVLDLIIGLEILNSLQTRGPSSRFQNVDRAHRKTLHWLWKEGERSPGFVDWL
jgi:hypothetical protein